MMRAERRSRLSNPVSNGEITVSNQSCPSYALIDGAEISELDLLRYEVTRARTAALLLYEKIGVQGMAEVAEGRDRDDAADRARVGHTICP
jgi:hypothetical protein